MTRDVLPALDEAARLLRTGGLVAFPTETVYGLGANALDPAAVARIFEAKRRPAFDPLIVHLPSWESRAVVVADWPRAAEILVEAFPAGPLTLVLPRSGQVPGLVTSGLPSVAVRVPDHPVAAELLRAAGVPVAAPSANRFGHLSPTTAAHVRASLGDAVDLVVDGGPTTWGVESTIVDLTAAVPTVVRFGATTVEDLEAVLGEMAVSVATSSRPTAPGQLASHYAPRTPLRLVDGPVDDPAAAYLAFSRAPEQSYVAVEVLSPEGDLREAAARLFDALHRLDAAGAPVIHAERVPDRGLGRAINDRLTRAAV